MTQPEPTNGPPIDSTETIATSDQPLVTYAMADGEPIWGEYSFVTTLDGFEDRDDEVRLIKRTYRLISEEEIVLPDPFPIEDDEESDFTGASRRA